MGVGVGKVGHVSERPFFARRVEAWTNRRLEAALKLVGWRESIVGYTGYGTPQRIRVLGRVVLRPPSGKIVDLDQLMHQRGWRNFIATPATRAQVRIRVGERIIATKADADGYFDVRITDHGLEQGWQSVEVSTPYSEPDLAPIQVVGADIKYGIISDVDDTIITTFLPRFAIAMWNSLVLTEDARKPVKAMAEMLQGLLADRPGAPIVYVSTGSWDTSEFLHRFLDRHGYPQGAFLLSDWGPTNTGWFRSGQEHKRRAIRELMRDLPRIRWVLIGDDGQHDPVIYNEVADSMPKRVRAIGIRELTDTEHVLAHGYPNEIDEEYVYTNGADVPEVRAPDGVELLQLLGPLVRKRKKQHKTQPDTPTIPA